MAALTGGVVALWRAIPALIRATTALSRAIEALMRGTMPLTRATAALLGAIAALARGIAALQFGNGCLLSGKVPRPIFLTRAVSSILVGMKGKARQIPATDEGHLPSIPFNVLGYKEEGEWVALALEMDLRGYGETFEQALAELADLAAMQIGFARFKGQPELVWKPAEPVWFQLFADMRRQHLEALLREGDLASSEYQVAGLQIPPAALLASIKSGFSPSKT